MWGYILRRLLYAIPIVIGVKAIVFLLFSVAAGDPAEQMAGRHATPARLAEIRHKLGTDKDLGTQFWHEMTSFEDARKRFERRQTSSTGWPTRSFAIASAIST